MKTRKVLKKVLTYILTIALIVSCINVPYVNSYASGTIDTDRTNSSGVTATIASQGTPSNDWSGFDMTIHNNTGSSICDWVIVMNVPSGTASAFKCWNATFVADGDTIYLYPMQEGTNAVVPSGTLAGYNPGFGFGGKYVNPSDIKVTKILFNYGTSSSEDYSQGNTNDNPSGGNTGGTTVTIPSGTVTEYNYPEVEYNYAKLLQYSLYFYDANMCGDQVGEHSLHSWRDDCHTYDKYSYRRSDGSTVTVDLTGGFHDAGDHVKFGLPEAYAAFTLGMSYDTNKKAYVSAKQVEHLQTITTHFADYLVDCAVLNSSGTAVEAYCVQVGNGGGGNDHGYWGAPEDQPQGNRTAYFSSSSEPHTDIVSLSAAALAMQYKNFGGEKYLETAKMLFAYAKNNSKSVGKTSSSFYVSSNWEDDYCLAALLLYQITGESQYQSEYNNIKSDSAAMKPYWPLGWDNVGPAVAYYAGDSGKLSTLMGIGDGNSNYGGYRCLQDWGSARYNTSLQYTGLLYDKMTGTSSYRSWAEGQMKYLMGNNAAKQCFIVGFNDFSAKYPHHRAASGYTGGDKGTTPQKYVLTGALVGGQKTDGTYIDSASDYICNEVAIDYNATLVAAAAAIYEGHISETSTQKIDTSYHVDSSAGGSTGDSSSSGGNTGSTGGSSSSGGNTGSTGGSSSSGGNTGSTGGSSSTGGTSTGDSSEITGGGNTGGTVGEVIERPEEFVAPEIEVSYRTHIQTFGWEDDGTMNTDMWKKDGQMSGTSGMSKRLEGINIVVESKDSSEPVNLGIQYTTHCQNYGWLPWSANGDMNGTEGESKRLEAIMIKLTGSDAKYYDVYYRVHAQNYGWLNWASNGSPAGTAGYSKRLEGIQIVVVKKGADFNRNADGIPSTCEKEFYALPGNSPIVNYPATSNTDPVVPGDTMANVTYRTHVQNYGWQGWKYNGQMSGTSGESKRLEGINIKLTNKPYDGGIAYTTHVQTYGWQGDENDSSKWMTNGKMSGTSGESKRLEAIKIKLTGEMAEHYDIYYRVHAQTYGWLGWAKNGDPAGTAGLSRRLEGIQIVLVKKGENPPANTYMGETSARTEAYIQK